MSSLETRHAKSYELVRQMLRDGKASDEIITTVHTEYGLEGWQTRIHITGATAELTPADPAVPVADKPEAPAEAPAPWVAEKEAERARQQQQIRETAEVLVLDTVDPGAAAQQLRAAYNLAVEDATAFVAIAARNAGTGRASTDADVYAAAQLLVEHHGVDSRVALEYAKRAASQTDDTDLIDRVLRQKQIGDTALELAEQAVHHDRAIQRIIDTHGTSRAEAHEHLTAALGRTTYQHGPAFPMAAPWTYRGQVDWEGHLLPQHEQDQGLFLVPRIVLNVLAMAFQRDAKLPADVIWGYKIERVEGPACTPLHRRALLAVYATLPSIRMSIYEDTQETYGHASIAAIYRSAHQGRNPSGNQTSVWQQLLYDLSVTQYHIRNVHTNIPQVWTPFNVQFDPTRQGHYLIGFSAEQARELTLTGESKRASRDILDLDDLAFSCYATVEPILQKYHREDPTPTKSLNIQKLLKRFGRLQDTVYRSGPLLSRYLSHQHARFRSALRQLQGRMIPQLGRLNVSLRKQLLVSEVLPARA